MPNKIMQGYIAKDGKMVKTGGGSSGTIDHSKLTPESRALPDQHPIGAVTGLQDKLSELAKSIQDLGVVFNYKGSKPTKNELPQTGNKTGDVWFVIDESVGYIWLESNKWEPFGPTIDLSGYLEKNKLADTTGTAIDNAMSQDATTKELNKKINSPIAPGEINQFLVSDGKGGTIWKTFPLAKGVKF